LRDGVATVGVQLFMIASAFADGPVAGMCAQSLGVGLDAKLDAIKADGSKELEEIKEQLLLKEAGVSAEGQCLLILRSR
jgi:hypothetical protein